MASLMLINPRSRKRRTTRRKARRNPAPAVAKKAAPMANPRRRRRSPAVAAYRRKARRNPIGLGKMGGIGGQLMGATQAAAGAVAVDYLFDFLPLPDTMKSGYAGLAVKGAAAIALGMFGRKLLGKTAEKMAEGALTVAAYTAIRSMLPVATPAAAAGLGYTAPALQMAEYVNPDPYAFQSRAAMGEYVGNGGSGGYGY